MKHIKIISLLFLTAFFGNSKAQTYNQPAEVISSGGGESTGGNYTNFGVIGETFVGYSVTGGNYNTSIGFPYTSETTVGINENQLNSQNISIFPNPNSGKFIIEIKITEPQDFELKLFNALGQQIYREYFGTVSGTFQKVIDISNFANGIYTVQLITEKGTVNKQITVY